MKKEKKQEVMTSTTCELNGAKDRIYEAVQKLHENGMNTESEQLMKIIYRIEAIQNKYNY